ncbi:MAG: FtsW/RodA/SpoVE family cell cycle protein [Oscillospiraceae bacterium]|jgi:rod shape determining protein RodA|nr:FtsW/RodA/SpoVE family cell cycle protein [Oscillospiraceae bacterium]
MNALKHIRAYLRSSDMLLLIICLISSFYGLMLVVSASASYDSRTYTVVQLAAILIGLCLFLLFSLLDSETFTDRWYLLIVFELLMAGSLMLWGVEGGTGNRSWLRFAGIGIQPSEVIKPCFVLLLAKHMAALRRTERGVSYFPALLSLLAHFAFMFLLIVYTSSDLGSALVFLVIFAAMLFAGGVRPIWFLAGIAACAALAPLIWKYVLGEYQRARIIAPYRPELVDPEGLGVTWQVRQSRAAIASGGLTGRGYMKGVLSQSDMLPYKHTDFIFSVCGEEFGLVGCILIVLLLTIIILRCIYVGMHCGSYMNMLVCVGFSAMLTFQAFENIGMCLGLTPVIGITLPFFSYGGSSAVCCFACMGIVSGIRMRPRTSPRRKRKGKNHSR